ncbi:MAG: hypothetical protein Q7U75_03555, partial [Desulfobacterales bacterium]|nr:hypothetical protein [Desulfobacterales bacterium]
MAVMPAETIIAETGVATDSIKSESRLSVVVAYGGIAAGKHAMCVLNRLSSRLCGGIEFFPILWSFDMLSDRDASEEAMGDAVNADILVVATIDIGPLPMGVAWWLDSAI